MARKDPNLLLRLQVANLHDAIDLGLVDIPESDLVSIESRLTSIWKDNPNSLASWDDSNSLLFSSLDRAHRPLTAFRGRPLAVTRVFPAKNLRYFFSDLPAELARSPRFLGALGELQEACDTIADRAGLQRAFDELRSCVCPHGLGVPSVSIYTRALSNPRAPCWVGRRASLRIGTSQEWRDRLGLEHYPYRDGVARPTVQGDALVRATFLAALSNSALPREDPKRHVRSEPEGMWLIRPAVIHGGNRRFVQRRQGDRISEPCKHGKTIDIATSTYPESERELVLVHGERAKVSWLDVELLDGIPERRPQDDLHEPFLNVISARHGWK